MIRPRTADIRRLSSKTTSLEGMEEDPSFLMPSSKIDSRSVKSLEMSDEEPGISRPQSVGRTSSSGHPHKLSTREVSLGDDKSDISANATTPTSSKESRPRSNALVKKPRPAIKRGVTHEPAVMANVQETSITSKLRRNRAATIANKIPLNDDFQMQKIPLETALAHLTKKVPSISIQESTEEEIYLKFLSNFPKTTKWNRQTYLLGLLKECDPVDMKFLNLKLPLFHRDFFNLLDKKTAFQILEYIHPRDIVTCSLACTTWAKFFSSKDVWYSLYTSMGLASMASVFHLKNGSVKDNAKKYYSIFNWAHGIFSYRSFQAHSLAVLCMSFDGKTVCTGSSDKSCKLYSIKNGECLRVFEGHDESINAVQHDDQLVVTGSVDRAIKVWSNKDEGLLLCTMHGHEYSVTCLKMNSGVLISGSADKTVRIWDLSSFYEVKAVIIAEPSSDLLPEQVQQAEPRRRKRNKSIAPKSYCLRTLHGHECAVKSLDFYGDIIISGYCMIWQRSTGNCLNVIGFHPKSLEIIHIGPPEAQNTHAAILNEPIAEIQYSGKRLLASTLSGYAFLNDVAPLPEKSLDPYQDYTNHFQWANAPANFKQKEVYQMRDSSFDVKDGMMGKWSLFSKSDEWSGGSGGYLTVYNHRIGKFIYKLKTQEDLVVKVDNARPGSFAAMRSKYRSEVTLTLTSMSFDDHYIVSVGTDGKVHVWEPNMPNSS